MKRPSIILADDPTGKLDTSNTRAVFELLWHINGERRTGFVIVAHDRGVAEMTDRILEI